MTKKRAFWVHLAVQTIISFNRKVTIKLGNLVQSQPLGCSARVRLPHRRCLAACHFCRFYALSYACCLGWSCLINDPQSVSALNLLLIHHSRSLNQSALWVCKLFGAVLPDQWNRRKTHPVPTSVARRGTPSSALLYSSVSKAARLIQKKYLSRNPILSMVLNCSKGTKQTICKNEINCSFDVLRNAMCKVCGLIHPWSLKRFNRDEKYSITH